MQWHINGIIQGEIPEGAIGFTYIIYYTDGTFYCGKKLACSLRKKPPLKGMRKNARRMVMTEHKWREYEGSSEDVDDKFISSKRIIGWYRTKIEMTYREIELLMKVDALNDENCVNKSIQGKFYKGILQGAVE